MNKLLIFILLVFTVFVLGCGAQNQTNNGVQSETPVPVIPSDQSPPEMIVEDTNEPELVEIDLTAKRWEFEPNTITVKEGDRVKLNIRSLDVDHGISIPQFNVNNKNLKPGATTVVEFTADKKGTFSFSCNVFCGSGHEGMKGTLIVE